MCVVRGGRECPCGSRGCWERYCSGTALLAAYLDRGGDPERSGPDITSAAINGDPRARAALEDVGDWLGHGLASLVAVLDPGLIVVGGGVSQAGDLLLEPRVRSMTESMTGGGRRPNPIVAGRNAGEWRRRRGSSRTGPRLHQVIPHYSEYFSSPCCGHIQVVDLKNERFSADGAFGTGSRVAPAGEES